MLHSAVKTLRLSNLEENSLMESQRTRQHDGTDTQSTNSELFEPIRQIDVLTSRSWMT